MEQILTKKKESDSNNFIQDISKYPKIYKTYHFASLSHILSPIYALQLDIGRTNKIFISAIHTHFGNFF